MAIILKESDIREMCESPAAMDELLESIADSLKAFSQNRVKGQTRVETGLIDERKKFRVMTAAVPDAGFGMRISALFRGAKDAYFHLLFDNDSGDLLALVAGRELNVWRTGAPAGVACRHLAPAEPKVLGLLGSGRQARGQLVAIRRALPSLEQVRIFSPNEAHRNSFADKMSGWLGMEVHAVDSAREAVVDAAVVSVATSSRSPVLEADWILPGALVITITSGQLPEALIARSRLIVSWTEELLGGEGPRQPYTAMMAAGTWSADKIAGELGDVLLGKVPGRRSTGETIVFESVGMPIWDTVATAWAYRWASNQRCGTELSLE